MATPNWKRRSSSSEMCDVWIRSVSQTAIVRSDVPLSDDVSPGRVSLTACRCTETS